MTRVGADAGRRTAVERIHEVHERFDVLHQVPLVPQLTGMSCWAAGAAMIIGWRDCIDVDGEELARGSGRWEEYRDGLRPRDVAELARRWGLESASALPLTVHRLRQLLEDRGPLWVGEASPELHVVVVAGLSGDGTPDGTRVRVLDPWPIGRGERYTVPFRDFVAGLETASRLAGPPARILFSRSRGRGPRWSSSSRSERTSVTWRSDGEAPRVGAPMGLLERYLRPPTCAGGTPRRAYRPALLIDGAVRGYWTAPDGHVREWTLPGTLDLVTEPIAAPPAAGDPAVFRLGARRCVVYRDGAGGLRLCWHAERWRCDPPMEAAEAEGDPQAFGWGAEIRIVYRGRGGGFHVLRGGERGWKREEELAPGSDPAGWLSRHGPRFVQRRERDGHLVVIGWGERRGATDVSAASGAPPATLAPAAFSSGDQDYIVYRGQRGDVHLIEGREGRWSHADLHVMSEGAPPAASRPCAVRAGAATHVIYRADDDHLHALSRIGARWAHTDLLATAGVSAGAVAAGDPVATSVGDGPCVLYVGRDGALRALVLGAAP